MSSQQKILKNVDTLSQRDKVELDQLLTRFFVNCNIPFEIVENEHFIQLIRKHKPAYNLPHRTKLSTTLLDQEEARVSISTKLFQPNISVSLFRLTFK